MNNILVPVDEKTRDLLTYMPYRVYLETEYWKQVKEAFYKNNLKECLVCKSKKKLHVHHFNYESRGQETLNDLACLCEDCHFALHNYQKKVMNFGFWKIDTLAALREIISIGEYAKSQMDNKNYTALLPLTKRSSWSIAQVIKFWDIPKTKTLKLLRKYSELKVVTIRNNGKKKPEACFIDSFVWYLIEFDFPKVK